MKKSFIQIVFLIFLFLTFGIGAYVYSGTDMKNIIQKMQYRNGVSCMEGLLSCQLQEGFGEPMPTQSDDSKEEDSVNSSPKDSSANCYDLLVRRGNQILMYNTKAPANAKTNPIVFSTLVEYENYLDAQKKKGIHCPVLYLREETGTQGNTVYRATPNPFDTNNTLPITSSIMLPVNTGEPIKTKKTENSYASFDPMGLYVGKITDVDLIHYSTQNAPISDNPMDPNWGGVLYTQAQIDSGKYDENIVTRVAYPRAGALQVGVPNTNMNSEPTRELNLARMG
jgi:hypothetical protein